ncbi:hypothetical protein QR680_002002 [Steinernema hermaphroditum]|uniref:Major facilitator superfamily (MFS) profile domain-containing protein n=1 Tax=Steinernema hermaphroditum TaxID=289476 RepID=A0AA39H3L5_9BILA|nr:hypothetical protein QR680_002002 [Steinernema hermaphroditum]
MIGCGRESTCLIFGTRTRFVLLPIVMLALTSIWSNIIVFNFVLLCMAPPEAINSSNTYRNESRNDAVEISVSRFGAWEKSWITGAVALGALAAHFPIVHIVNKYSLRIPFFCFGLLSSITTILLPQALGWGYGWAIFLRVLQGIAFAGNFPAIGKFTSKWTYYKQNGMFVSTCVAFIQLSPTITNPVAGALCSSDIGWRWAVYGHGKITLIIFLLFFMFYRDEPRAHPFVSDIEASKIERQKSIILSEQDDRVPYKSILKTKAVWAVWMAGIGNFFCVNTIFLFSSAYFMYVLDFAVAETGLNAAIPSVLQFLLKLFCGFISDKIRCVNETNKLRIFNSIAFFGSTIFFITLSFLDSSHKQTCMILMSIATGFLGFSTGGFFKAGAMISGNYNHFVTGNISLTKTFTMLIVPFVVTGIAPANSAAQWKIVFYIIAAVLVATNLFFVIFINANAPEWSKMSEQPNVVSTQYRIFPRELQPDLKHTCSSPTIMAIDVY